MKITCPKCGKAVPPDQINVSKDIAYCPPCGWAFSVSESVDSDPMDSLPIEPPSGAWVREEPEGTVVGASTRSPIAFFLIPFMCVWSGGSLGGIYGTQIVQGKFIPFLSLFGIPFLIGTVVLGTLAIMAAAGKIEVTVGRDSKVFVGVGNLGWTRSFDWSEIQSILSREVHGRNGTSYRVVLNGPKPIQIPSGLNLERQRFVAATLRRLLASRSV